MAVYTSPLSPVDLASYFYPERKSLMDSQFWLVWTPQGSVPTKQHGTQALAKAEADRLSLKHPGQRFYVLEAVGYSTKRDTDWVDLTDSCKPW